MTANIAGFLIYSKIYKVQQDVYSVYYAYTNAGRAWSAFGAVLKMLNQDIYTLYNSIAVYLSYGRIVFGQDNSRNIAIVLGEKNKVKRYYSNYPVKWIIPDQT